MNYQIKCETCGEKCWVPGSYEPDTNAVVLNENRPWEDACTHIRGGGGFEVVGEEAEGED
jgi:hypothetical protein